MEEISISWLEIQRCSLEFIISFCKIYISKWWIFKMYSQLLESKNLFWKHLLLKIKFLIFRNGYVPYVQYEFWNFILTRNKFTVQDQYRVRLAKWEIVGHFSLSLPRDNSSSCFLYLSCIAVLSNSFPVALHTPTLPHTSNKGRWSEKGKEPDDGRGKIADGGGGELAWWLMKRRHCSWCENLADICYLTDEVIWWYAGAVRLIIYR